MVDADQSFYISLYRRFRPQRFSELLGQQHVASALSKAVETNRVGHAYLFSGPRGTGKTSTARILAKALNCQNPENGEPCGSCRSCIEIAQGSSLDVHELDAASNNGVEAMRDLISKAALGTPGKWKIYIIDEVHMLSTAASNALLKTLEEPPSYVVFVLATTDPQKVLPTIKSRTQHFEFHLLSNQTLKSLIEEVAAKANIELTEQLKNYVIRRARGSARDALSVLELALASQEVIDEDDIVSLFEAINNSDTELSINKLDQLIQAGLDPQSITMDLIEIFRDSFLNIQAPMLSNKTVKTDSTALSTAKVVRAIEELGKALVVMRDCPDPRIPLELALIKLTKPELDENPLALVERMDRIEAQLQEIKKNPVKAVTQQSTQTLIQTPRSQSSLFDRPTIGALRSAPLTEQQITTQPTIESPLADNVLDARDDLTLIWGDQLITKLSSKAREMCSTLSFKTVKDSEITASIGIKINDDQAESLIKELEDVIGNYYNKSVIVNLITPEKTYQSNSATKQAIEKIKSVFEDS